MITTSTPYCWDVRQQAFVRGLYIRHIGGSGIGHCGAVLERHDGCVGNCIVEEERTLSVSPLSSIAGDLVAQWTK